MIVHLNLLTLFWILVFSSYFHRTFYTNVFKDSNFFFTKIVRFQLIFNTRMVKSNNYHALFKKFIIINITIIDPHHTAILLYCSLTFNLKPLRKKFTMYKAPAYSANEPQFDSHRRVCKMADAWVRSSHTKCQLYQSALHCLVIQHRVSRGTGCAEKGT